MKIVVGNDGIGQISSDDGEVLLEVITPNPDTSSLIIAHAIAPIMAEFMSPDEDGDDDSEETGDQA